MSTRRSPRSPMRPQLALALAALAASGCVGPFRRFVGPEQRVTDVAAARSCAVETAAQLGYLATTEESAPRDSTGESRFTAERRSAAEEGMVVDQLVVSVSGGGDQRGTLRVVPTRYVEDSQRAITSGRAVPRLRPPGPAEATRQLESDGVRRRRVNATVPRRDALEVTTRCAHY